MIKLKGKKAIITGGGKGIGKAIALAFAMEGIDIGIIARSESDLKNVSDEVVSMGVNCSYAIADVSEMNSINKGISDLKNKLGAIDILINNAGIGAFGKFMEMAPEEWEHIIKVNLLGAYYTTRAVLPEMIERKSGDIINISSTAGKAGSAVTSAYSASKFGLIGMSESLMQEVRKYNIRVTTFLPSTVATDMAKDLKLTDGNTESIMQPEDVAEIIVSQLKLNKRVFVKEIGLWSTNP